MRQGEERKKYVQGSRGSRRHTNKNPPRETNQGKSAACKSSPCKQLEGSRAQKREEQSQLLAISQLAPFQRRACGAQAPMCQHGSWEGKQLPNLAAGLP